MKKYIFKTTATMKEYNSRKWWIDSGIIPEKTIEAESVADALDIWRADVENRHYIGISNNALKTKQPMYIDQADGTAQQVGYVITGKTEFEDRDSCRWSTQFIIDLWVNIITVIDTVF